MVSEGFQRFSMTFLTNSLELIARSLMALLLMLRHLGRLSRAIKKSKDRYERVSVGRVSLQTDKLVCHTFLTSAPVSAQVMDLGGVLLFCVRSALVLTRFSVTETETWSELGTTTSCPQSCSFSVLHVPHSRDETL
ncbi:uncharacterized [Tachysurus ichikawai]